MIPIADPDLDGWLTEMGPTYPFATTRADGSLAGVFITATLSGQIWLGDRTFVAERYSYASLSEALAAYLAWCARDTEGEPDGWIRHQPSDRRREDGDPTRETVRP